VHGANRLGANSLLDIVVFGRATAKRVAELVKPNSPHKPLPANAGAASIAMLDSVRYSKGQVPTAEARSQLQQVMQANAAVFRTQETLAEGCKQVDEVGQLMNDLQVSWPHSLPPLALSLPPGPPHLSARLSCLAAVISSPLPPLFSVPAALPPTVSSPHCPVPPVDT